MATMPDQIHLFSLSQILKGKCIKAHHILWKYLLHNFQILALWCDLLWALRKCANRAWNYVSSKMNHGRESSFFTASPCILEPWNTPSPTRYTYTYVRSSSRKVRCSASWRDIVVFRASETPRTPDLNSEGSWVLHDRTPVEASFYFYSFKIAKFLWT